MIEAMIASAWNNGSHRPSGAGYGIKIAAKDRDLYFKREWKKVVLHLEGVSDPIEVNVGKPSFWGPDCRELIGKGIGLWLIGNGRAPWPEGSAPKLELRPIGAASFRVRIVG